MKIKMKIYLRAVGEEEPRYLPSFRVYLRYSYLVALLWLMYGSSMTGSGPSEVFLRMFMEFSEAP